MKKTLQRWLWPLRCPLCEKILLPEEGLVCAKCRGGLPWVSGPVCMKCGRPVQSETREYCGRCAGRDSLYVRGMSAFLYEGKLRESVLRMKFHNRRVYLPFFAAGMLERCGRELFKIRPEVLIPVPMHPRKRRERGFDQCALLAEELSARTGIPVQKDNLVRLRYTRPQKGLDAWGRRTNLTDAFSVRFPERLPRRVMLVDDIYTTGATIDACCEALRSAGARDIYFITLCMAGETKMQQQDADFPDPGGEIRKRPDQRFRNIK